jgi:hypothetical protein
MICISQAELDGKTGAVTEMLSPVKRDDDGWMAFQDRHPLVD